MERRDPLLLMMLSPKDCQLAAVKYCVRSGSGLACWMQRCTPWGPLCINTSLASLLGAAEIAPGAAGALSAHDTRRHLSLPVCQEKQELPGAWWREEQALGGGRQVCA